jgi:hypothetical protein
MESGPDYVYMVAGVLRPVRVGSPTSEAREYPPVEVEITVFGRGRGGRVLLNGELYAGIERIEYSYDLSGLSDGPQLRIWIGAASVIEGPWRCELLELGELVPELDEPTLRPSGGRWGCLWAP